MRALSLSLLLGLLCISVAGAVAEVAPLRDRVELGAYVAGLPYFDKGAREFVQLEQKLGTKLTILSGFVDWEYVFGNERDLRLTAGGTRTLLYSWEPHCQPNAPTDCISYGDVVRGEQDEYLRRIAASMKKFPYVIYLRPWGEMNADWSPWQPGTDRPRAGTHQEFIHAWRHVRDLFVREGVHNVKLVFNPDASDWETSTKIERIWPGNEYVDVLGIDGYNWGNGVPSAPGEWTEFEDVFEKMYGILTALHPTAPVWLCEVGSKEPQKSDGTARPAPRDKRHKKGAWIDAMMSSRAFPRVTALVAFNIEKERDFRFESSQDSLRAIRRQLKLRAAPVRTVPR
jgi:hypothetical protein